MILGNIMTVSFSVSHFNSTTFINNLKCREVEMDLDSISR